MIILADITKTTCNAPSYSAKAFNTRDKENRYKQHMHVIPTNILESNSVL